MKAVRTLLAFVLGTAIFASCDNSNYSPVISEPDGYRTMKTTIIDVDKSDWKYTDYTKNNYFYVTVDLADITQEVFVTGIVKMYCVLNYNSSSPSQVEMPYTRHSEYSLGNGEWGFYTETVDYEFSIGELTICYTASDFDYEVDDTFTPEAMEFRCVVMY